MIQKAVTLSRASLALPFPNSSRLCAHYSWMNWPSHPCYRRTLVEVMLNYYVATSYHRHEEHFIFYIVNFFEFKNTARTYEIHQYFHCNPGLLLQELLLLCVLTFPSFGFVKHTLQNTIISRNRNIKWQITHNFQYNVHFPPDLTHTLHLSI